jgi:hypothetical protein
LQRLKELTGKLHDPVVEAVATFKEAQNAFQEAQKAFQAAQTVFQKAQRVFQKGHSNGSYIAISENDRLAELETRFNNFRNRYETDRGETKKAIEEVRQRPDKHAHMQYDCAIEGLKKQVAKLEGRACMLGNCSLPAVVEFQHRNRDSFIRLCSKHRFYWEGHGNEWRLVWAADE